jgi:uncharacterized protein (UPF0335 family)
VFFDFEALNGQLESYKTRIEKLEKELAASRKR